MQRDQPPTGPGDLGRGRGTAGESRAASDTHRGLPASRMDSARLRQLRGARVLREGAQVLRFRALVEVRQAIGAVGTWKDKANGGTKTGIRKTSHGFSQIYTVR